MPPDASLLAITNCKISDFVFIINSGGTSAELGFTHAANESRLVGDHVRHVDDRLTCTTEVKAGKRLTRTCRLMKSLLPNTL